MNDWINAEQTAERGEKLYRDGLWEQAAGELRSAIAVNPYNPLWHHTLALSLEAMEDYPGACAACRNALRLSSDDVDFINTLGLNLMRLGKYARAIKCFRQIERIDPDFEPSYCNRIIAYTQMGDHEQAELMFYLARQVRDECPLCWYNLGISFYVRRRYGRAVECWENTLRLDPNHPQTRARMADACWALGDLPQALRHYRAELAVYPDDVETMLDMGGLLMEMDSPLKARKTFIRALKCEPQCAEAHYCLGELAAQNLRFGEAARQFRLTLKIDPEFPGANLELARRAVRRRRRQEVLEHISAELRISGDMPRILDEAGRMLLEVKMPQKALEVFSRLVELTPRDPKAHHNMAVCLFRLGRLAEGMRHCRKALKLRPDYSLALYNLALAHLRAGSRRRARRCAARALALAPDNGNIRLLWRRLNLCNHGRTRPFGLPRSDGKPRM